MRSPELAMTTDFGGNKVPARPQLEKIAQAGFTHDMWCHGWNLSETYSREDMSTIKGMHEQFGLKTVDVHGSIGEKREFLTPDKKLQDQGIALVRNRMKLAAVLGSDTLVMHVPADKGWWIKGDVFWSSLDRALTKIAPDAKSLGVSIAFENLEHKPNNFGTIQEILNRYPASLVGLCYDSGHGNVQGNGLKDLEATKDRLTAVHLHDNAGKTDEHLQIFKGSNNWEETARILAKSSYQKPLSFESTIGNVMGMDHDDKQALTRAYTAGIKLHSMVQNARNNT